MADGGAVIVVFTTAPVSSTPKYGCVWPHIVHTKMLGAVVELMLQALEREHGTAYELPTYEGERE